MKINVIADITRAYAGSEKNLIESIFWKYARNFNVIYVVCHNSQMDSISNLISTDSIYIVKDDASPDEIKFTTKGVIDAILRSTYSSLPIDIYSFYKSVFDLQFIFNDPTINISFLSWSKSRQRGNSKPKKQSNKSSISSPKEYRWPENYISIEDSVQILKDALRSSNRQTHKTDIRGLLTLHDERFSKSYSSEASQPGLISLLLKEAESQGAIYIQDDLKFNQNPIIKLSDPEHYNTNQHSELLARTEDYEVSYSQTVIEALSMNNLGPFSRIRHIMYDILTEYINCNKGKLYGFNAIESTIEISITKCAEININPERYPWRKIRSFLYKVLNINSVFIDEHGNNINVSIENANVPIYGVDKDIHKILDASLLSSLLESGIDIDISDIRDLTGALFFDRSEEKQNFVYQILQSMVADELVLPEAPGSTSMRLNLA